MYIRNATDPKAFYPRIITSVKLTENQEAKLCKTTDGKNLIIDRQIGKIGEEEFKKRAKELLDGNSDNNDSDIGIDNGFEFLR